MKVNTFAKVGASIAAAATLSLGLCVSTAHAATPSAPTATQEDPTTNGYLVGVGSDTIQDVIYGISQDLGDGPDGLPEMTSWTATGTTPMTYRSGMSLGAVHPNGSGPGYKALEDSMGVTAAGNANVGDVDFARASGFQSNANVTQPTVSTTYTTAPQAGVITEIPFAMDSISFAVPKDSPFLLTNGGKGLTEAELASIYDGSMKYISTTDGSLSATGGTGLEPINAFVPKPGSGSRQFFLKGLNAVDSSNFGTLGYSSTNKGDTLYTTGAAASAPAAGTPYVGATDYSGGPVEEHDASVIVKAPSNVAAIAPFSGAKYLGYHNGVIADPSGKTAGTDYQLVPFDSAIGGTDHAVLPYTTNSDGSLSPNPAYVTDAVEGAAKLTREVYVIIPTAAIATPSANAKYRALYDTFVGRGSKVCLDIATISAYGFMKDPNCGETGQSADVASTSTLTVTGPAKMVAGGSAKFTVAASSVGNGGGTATVTINGTAHTVTIPAGKTSDLSESATITVPTPTAGTFKIGANNDGFTPNLSGVAASQESPSSYTVAKATPTVTASAPKVAHTKAGKVTVAVAATGLKPTGTVTVVIKKGTATKATVKNKALVGGKVVVALPKLAKGKYDVYVAYSGNADINKTASKKLASLTVS
ncbi:MAG: hypothetical protein FWE71_16260 [Nocardioidaceae bacterium]|nr:hypothetical protein [Nocardioidaceae bacterium]MCL2614321.1 hypothetical protein [Nocardioidaceae bacterium]